MTVVTHFYQGNSLTTFRHRDPKSTLSTRTHMPAISLIVLVVVVVVIESTWIVFAAPDCRRALLLGLCSLCLHVAGRDCCLCLVKFANYLVLVLVESTERIPVENSLIAAVGTRSDLDAEQILRIEASG